MQKGTDTKTSHDMFYELYEPLRKRFRLQAHIRSSIYESEEDFIEIYEGYGEERKLLFRTKGDLEDCYRQMTHNLALMLKRQEKSR